MAKLLKRAANLSLLTNIFLFLLKGIVGVLSNSIAVISDAINSLTDIVSSAAINYSVIISLQKPDKEHQVGHNAAQPIAVFIISLFAAVVGIEIIKESVYRIINPSVINITLPVYIVLVVSITVKLLLTGFQAKVGKIFKSPGLKASAVDSLNDVLASSISIIGVIGVQLGFKYIDGIAGILISLIIFRSAYTIAKENIGYLMGNAADESLIIDIVNIALKVEGVKGLNDLRSHYLGNKIHIEIHVEVDKNESTEKSHDIGVEVREKILRLPEINQVYVHIDPV